MPSYTKNTFIVFLELPENISRQIDKVRSRYSNLKYKAHITLKQDEDFLIDGDKIARIVADAVVGHGPIEMTVRPCSYHRNKQGWNIYLPVESDDLRCLIKKASQALESRIDPKSPRAFLSTKWEQSRDFYMHISLKGTSKAEEFTTLFNKMRKDLLGLDLPDAIMCDSITIAQWNTRYSKWQKVKTIHLR
jgi:2'-5' RNA ligase